MALLTLNMVRHGPEDKQDDYQGLKGRTREIVEFLKTEIWITNKDDDLHHMIIGKNRVCVLCDLL